MEIEINLDEMAERYVRSMEAKVEIYKTKMWEMFVIGLYIGIITSIFITFIAK